MVFQSARDVLDSGNPCCARNAFPIVIAGGGIGGLACALALAQRRFSVVVLEQAAEFADVGVGLQVAPNALSVLDALGVGEEVKRDALMIQRMLLMDAIENKVVCDIPCNDEFKSAFGNGYAVAHRADVHGALLRACVSEPLVQLRTDHRVLDFALDETSVAVKLENGNQFIAAALIGADGIRSRIRQQLVGDGEPKRAPAIIYRSLVRANNMPEAYKHPFPTLWVGPTAHLIYYPVRDWSFFNVAGTVSAPTDACCEGEVEADVVLNAFRGWADEPLAVLRIPSRYQRFALRYRNPIESWSSGPVTLLGDAAHPMLHYIAQGAAMALEDAICLADCADQHDGEFPGAFKAYEELRIVRSARVQLSSHMLDRLYHAGGVERLVRNAVFEGRTEAQYHDRLSWLFTPPQYVRPPGCFRSRGRSS